MPEPLIHARNEIEQSDWMNPKVKELLFRCSVAVNRLSTPFDVRELVDTLLKYQAEPIRQVSVAYSVDPGFTRDVQYYKPPGYELDGGIEDIDRYNPGLFGLSRHFDGSIGIILFMRDEIRAIMKEELKGEQRYLRGAYDTFCEIRSFLQEQGKNELGPLAIVGVLPGVVLKNPDKYPSELVEMSRAKNDNTARLVSGAVGKVLQENAIPETNLVILGSNGSLGSQIVLKYPQAIQIDEKNQDNMPRSKGRYLIVDCTLGNALSKYIKEGRLSNEDGVEYVWLNESYPPVSSEARSEAMQGGYNITFLHILGVGASEDYSEKSVGITPTFPVYGSTSPCCMGLLDQPVDSIQIVPLDDHFGDQNTEVEEVGYRVA